MEVPRFQQCSKHWPSGRPYNDVEAEMANRLSIQPNFEAWCRLINIPKEKGTRPMLTEQHIVTEELGKGEADHNITEMIKEQSRKLGTPRAEVEKDLARRSFVHSENDDHIDTAEKIE